MRKFYRCVLFCLLAIFLGTPFPIFSQDQKVAEIDVSQIDTTIWKYLKAEDRSQWQISQEDSLRAVKEFFLPGYQVYQRISALSSNRRMPEDEKYDKMIQLFEESQDYFESALRLNPFTPKLKDFLKFVYKYLDGLYSQKKRDQKRLETLFKRVILEKDRKELYVVHFSISSIFSAHQQYQEAVTHCDSALDLIFDIDNFSEVDTTMLANVLYLKGYSFYQLNDGDRALQVLTRAKMVASGNLKKNISSLIYAISWDDGNINSFRLQSEGAKYVKQKNYEQAVKTYLKLLNTAKSQKVRRFAHYRLGSLEYYQLNRKEDALIRFWIQKNILSALPDTGAEIDSTRKIFLKTYAQMCFDMALKAKENDRQKAFFYFYQLTTFENQHRPRSYYFLADLTKNNIDICLNYCQKAFQTWDEFADFDKRNLAWIFYSTYSNRGEFDKALEWYKTYHHLQQENKKQ